MITLLYELFMFLAPSIYMAVLALLYIGGRK
jgi:hypothetical protein